MTLPVHGFTDWQGSLQTADLISANVGQNVNAGAFFTSSIFDMRGFSSYSSKVDTVLTGAATSFGAVNIVFSWTMDSAGTLPIYTETYQIFPNTLGSATFPNVYGRLVLQDAVHGPYLFITVNNAGPDQLFATISVTGNSRSLGRRYVQNLPTGSATGDPATYGRLYATAYGLAAGNSQTAIFPMSVGPVGIRFQVVTSTAVINLTAPDGNLIHAYNMGVGTDAHLVEYFPRCAVKMTLTNNGGVAGAGVVEFSAGRENW